ncbi:hypothetical protein [Bacillus mycoides]|uniref:hypothetical protein n=1 Tax=Bacillus mycoides TaxID=1405 RepID=UPI003D21DD01
MYTEFENEIRSYEVASFTAISKEEYQQLLNDKYEGVITVKERPINVMIAVLHHCEVCQKSFYNRAENMLGGVIERQHHCFVAVTGLDGESDKVRKRRLADIEARKHGLRKGQ